MKYKMKSDETALCHSLIGNIVFLSQWLKISVHLAIDNILDLSNMAFLKVDFTEDELKHREVKQLAVGCTASW